MRHLTTTFLCVFILSAGVGGFMLLGKQPDVPQKEDSDHLVPLVETAEIREHAEPVVISMDGDAYSWRVMTVGAQVKGQLIHRTENSRSGMLVQEGDLLFEIDSTNYQLEIERLEAQLNQIDEEIASVDVDVENTAELILLAQQDWQLQDKNLSRIQSAFDRKAAAENDLDTAHRQEITARNALQTLKNSRRAQQQLKKQKQASRRLVAAQLKQAQVDLSRCQVKAPATGRIVDDLAEEGDFVREGDELVHISDSSRIEVRCNLQADELLWVLHKVADDAEDRATALSDPLSTPLPCEVIYEFEGSEVIWDGLLARFEGTGMDRNTRTFPCRVTVPEPRKFRLDDSQGGRLQVAPSLLAGMYVTVRLPISSVEDLLQIPVEAIRPGGNLWVVRDGKLAIRRVSTSHSTGDYSLVSAAESDLQAGDKVIISPLVSARDGMDVRLEAAE